MGLGGPDMRRLRGTALAGERGQAAVEFVLIAPILLLLIIGMIEFARVFNMQQTIADAAREGARTAAVFDPQIDADSVRRVVQAKIAAAGFDAQTATITFYGNGVQNVYATNRGDLTAVQVEMPYRFVYLRRLMAVGFTGTGGIINLSSTARMRHE